MLFYKISEITFEDADK